MGKKLQSLRKIYAQDKHSSGSAPASSGYSALGKRQSAVSESDDGKSAKNNKKKNANAVDWKSLEKQQEEEASGSEDGSEDEEDSDNEGSEEGGGISLDGNLEHVVEDYTFEFNDMREEYSEGICTMLRKFIANPTEAYNLATVITAQTIVGTVVNCEGGQDSFAFATVLPCRKIEKVSPVVSILNSLSASLEKSLRAKANEELQLMKDCLPTTTSTSTSSSTSTSTTTATAGGAARTGLLLHKRFTNLPIQLVGALHRNLEEDVSWAQQQASDEDDELALDECEASSSGANTHHHSKPSSGKKNKRQANFFAEARNVLLLCECAVSKDSKSGYTLTDNACYDVLGSCSDILFASFEDEVYLQHASAAVLFRPPKQHCLTDLVALLVPISKLKTCVNGICALIPEE